MLAPMSPLIDDGKRDLLLVLLKPFHFMTLRLQYGPKTWPFGFNKYFLKTESTIMSVDVAKCSKNHPLSFNEKYLFNLRGERIVFLGPEYEYEYHSGSKI